MPEMVATVIKRKLRKIGNRVANREALQLEANTNQQNLILRFGTYLGPASALQMLGVMWGDEVPR